MPSRVLIVNMPAHIKPRSYVALARQVRSGETTPRAFLESCLDMITRLDSTVGAFLVLNVENARRAADDATARWRSGKPLSPIDGMPIGIKDIIETADMPTGQGLPLWKGFMTRRDSASVHALREAGAIILGETSTTEFAASEPWPGTFNPHDPSRTPGGSSSGSAAAVGAGMIRFLPRSARKSSARSCGPRVTAAASASSPRSARSTAAAPTII